MKNFPCTGIVQFQVWLSGLSCLPARRRSWMHTRSWTILMSRGRGSSNRPRTRQLAMMKLRSVVRGTTSENLLLSLFRFFLHALLKSFPSSTVMHDIIIYCLINPNLGCKILLSSWSYRWSMRTSAQHWSMVFLQLVGGASASTDSPCSSLTRQISRLVTDIYSSWFVHSEQGMCLCSLIHFPVLNFYVITPPICCQKNDCDDHDIMILSYDHQASDCNIVILLYSGGAVLPSNETWWDEGWRQDRGGGNQGLTEISIRSIELHSTAHQTDNNYRLLIIAWQQAKAHYVMISNFICIGNNIYLQLYDIILLYWMSNK